MKYSLKQLLFLVALVALACAGILFVKTSVLPATVTLAAFPFNSDSAIKITYTSACDRSTPLEYTVVKRGKTIVDHYLFAFVGCRCDIEPSELRLVKIAGNIVAIQESYVKKGEWKTVIIHDFDSGLSYPGNVSQEEIMKRLQIDLDFSIISR